MVLIEEHNESLILTIIKSTMRKTFFEKCINLRLCRVALVLFFLVPAISSLQANPSQNKTISGVVTSATDRDP